MTIVLTTNKRSTPELLSANLSEFAEINSINQKSISLRCVFSIRLDGQADPTSCQKVVLTLSDATQESIDAVRSIESKKNKLTPDIRLSSLRNNNRKLSLDENFEETFVSSNGISIGVIENLSSDKDNFSSVLPDNVGQVNSEILTYNISVSEKIIDALRYQFQTIDLFLPSTAELQKETRHLSSGLDLLNGSSLKKYVKYSLKSPTEFFSKDSFERVSSDASEQGFFAKQVVDYLINDVGSLSNTSLDEINFYIPTVNSRYLNSVDIPFNIELPLEYSSSRVIVKLDLFELSDFPEESITFQLDMSKLVENYRIIFDEPQIDRSLLQTNDKSLSNKHISFSYPLGSDFKKTIGFNFYKKSLVNNDNIFTLFRTSQLASQDSFVVDSVPGLEIIDSTHVIRVIPVTASGESWIFSDIVVGDFNQRIDSEALSLDLAQIENDSLELTISGVSSRTKKINIFKRNCTTSKDSSYELLNSITGISFSNIALKDIEITPGHILEYYVESTDEFGNLLQFSIPKMAEIVRNDENNLFNVTVSGFTSTENSVSFSIDAIQRQKRKINSVTSALRTVTGQLITNDSSGQDTVIEPKLENYSDSIIYRIKRTDQTTSEVAYFPLIISNPGAPLQNQEDRITDNSQGNTIIEFSDDITTQTANDIPSLVQGRTYVYDIFAYTRNPASTSNDFIITGIDADRKNWFYKPLKWSDPRVLNTGILYPEDERGNVQASDEELLMANPIGRVASQEVVIPIIEKSFDIAPVARKISRSLVQISWSSENKNYDSFIVFKIVNGRKYLLGKSCKEFIYHKITNDDLGTVYYQVTPLTLDYKFEKTYYSNEILIKEDLSYKNPVRT